MRIITPGIWVVECMHAALAWKLDLILANESDLAPAVPKLNATTRPRCGACADALCLSVL